MTGGEINQSQLGFLGVLAKFFAGVIHDKGARVVAGDAEVNGQLAANHFNVSFSCGFHCVVVLCLFVQCLRAFVGSRVYRIHKANTESTLFIHKSVDGCRGVV